MSLTEKMLGSACFVAGIVSVIFSLGLFQYAKITKKPEKIEFDKEKFLKFPNWITSIKSVVFIILALNFGAYIPYFNTSLFGMFVGGPVGFVLTAKQYPVLHVIKEGSTQDLRDLLDKGHPVNGRRYLNKKCLGTPLEYAVNNGVVGKVDLLLDRGATMETCEKHPIHLTRFRHRFLQNEEFFFKEGLVKSNEKYDDEYPLNLVAHQCSNDDVIEKRLEIYKKYGADFNIDNGRPIYIAAKKNCIKMVQALVEIGADTNLRYEDGMTILELIESGRWKKPDSRDSKFSPAITQILKFSHCFKVKWPKSLSEHDLKNKYADCGFGRAKSPARNKSR